MLINKNGSAKMGRWESGKKIRNINDPNES